MNIYPSIESQTRGEMYKFIDPEDSIELNKVCTFINNNSEILAHSDWKGRSILKISKKRSSCKYSLYLAKSLKKDDKFHIFIHLGKKYQIDKGGHKVVSHALNYNPLHLQLQQWVLAKSILDSPLRQEMAESEAAFLVSFPGREEILQTDLIGVLPTKSHDKQYIFMPFCELGSLANAFNHSLLLNEEDKKQIALDIVNAIVMLHSKNVAFRDIKPGNILLYRKDGKIRAKLSDFGLALSIQEKEWIKIETSPYLYSPEMLEIKALSGNQIKTNLLFPSDIWALGLTFYQLFLGTPAFKNEYELYRAKRRANPDMEAEFVTTYKKQVQDYLKTHLELEDKSELKSLIRQMLDIDYTKRPTIQEISQSLSLII